MLLPKIAVKNYQFTIIVFLLLSIFGITTYFSMPRMENPSVFIPGGSVVIIYPGASPADLEQQVVDPIEEAINELDDIKKMNSTMLDGLASIAVEFEFETDPKEKFDELVSKVNSVKRELPEEIFDIQMNRWTSTDVNILQLAFVSADAEYASLKRHAESLKRGIERQSGIRKVDIHAYPEQEVRVSLNLEKMAMMNIALDQVANAIQSNNANIPGGNISLQGRNFQIKTSGMYTSLDEIRNTVIHSYKGRLIYLENIADVSYNYEDINYYGRFNGQRSIFLSVQQKEYVNIFDIFEAIHPVISDFESSLPDNIHIAKVFDQSRFVDDRINGFLNNLLQGIILVGIIIFLALGVKSAFIVILAIPLSIVIGLAFVDIGEHGLQQISIAGLVVALGLLVDNSIVMVENISRFIKNGLKPTEAAIKGAGQIGWPIIAATLTTVLAFIPIIMMPDKAGDFIKSLPVTIIATLTVSLLLALTLTPLIASRILKQNDGTANRETWFTKKLQMLIEGPYRRSLAYALRNNWLTISFAFISLVLAGGLFLLVGISFFPKAEQPQFLVRVELPEGSGLLKTDSVTRKVETILDGTSDVKLYASNIGHGNPRIYYNTFPRSYNKNYAEIYVQLHDFDPYEFDMLIDSLRAVFSGITGARVQVKELEQGVPTAAPLEIYITGENVGKIKQIASFTEQLVKEQPGAINIENQLDKVRSDIFFKINKTKAGMLGIPIVEIDKTIRTCINGAGISKFRNKNGDEFEIVLRLPKNKELTLADFDKIYVSSLSGKSVPLKAVASIEFMKSTGIITHYNLQRNGSITADIEKGFTLDEVLEPVSSALESYPFPSGYRYHLMGEYEARQESFSGLYNAIVLAIIAIFAVLVLQFRSFVQPIVIFSAIPLAVLGSVIALYITGNTFSFTAFIGFISLVGIVVNNSIILVDYTNQLRKEGKLLDEALKIAGETRFTPIILTSLTTIGGLLPLTLAGGSLWAPLGWTIIGGLAVSTFLTLIVVPVLYRLFENKNAAS